MPFAMFFCQWKVTQVPDSPTKAEIVHELKREMRMREKVYPRMIAQEQMIPPTAAARIARLGAALLYIEQNMPEDGGLFNDAHTQTP